MNCLRCDAEMKFLMREKLQLGQTGWILGDLPNLVAGSLDVIVLRCPKCGKLEFFDQETVQNSVYDLQSELPQIECPECGTKHDFDYPKCPHCGHKYSK